MDEVTYETVAYWLLVLGMGTVVWLVLGGICLGLAVRYDPTRLGPLVHGSYDLRVWGGFLALVWPGLAVVLVCVVIGWALTTVAGGLASWVAGRRGRADNLNCFPPVGDKGIDLEALIRSRAPYLKWNDRERGMN